MRSKRQTTMAKLNRERSVKEKREKKREKKEARAAERARAAEGLPPEHAPEGDAAPTPEDVVDTTASDEA